MFLTFKLGFDVDTLALFEQVTIWATFPKKWAIFSQSSGQPESSKLFQPNILSARVTREWKKNCQIKKNAKLKKAKICASELNLKVIIIYIKPLLKLKNNQNKSCYETTDLSKSVQNFPQQKVAQNVAILLGLFIFIKNHTELPKVVQLVKNGPIQPSLCQQKCLPTKWFSNEWYLTKMRGTTLRNNLRKKNL